MPIEGYLHFKPLREDRKVIYEGQCGGDRGGNLWVSIAIMRGLVAASPLFASR